MNQRSLLLVVTGIVVGAIIATVAVKVADDDSELTSGRRTAVPVSTETPTFPPDETPQLTATPAPGTTPGPTSAPGRPPGGKETKISVTGTTTTTTTTRTTSAPSTRTAPPRPANINCPNAGSNRRFCTENSYAMGLKEGRLEGVSSSIRSKEPGDSGFPSFTFTSQLIGPNNEPARPPGPDRPQGDEVRRVDVSARIANPTDKTFVFPQGDFTLKVTKPDGSLQTHTAKVDGGYFELGPGGEATATFSFTPTQRNGNYSWSGETWYYEK